MSVCLLVLRLLTALQRFPPPPGIFAYLNYHVPRTRRDILEILLKGLRRLEYRGYDSAGEWPRVLICLSLSLSLSRSHFPLSIMCPSFPSEPPFEAQSV